MGSSLGVNGDLIAVPVSGPWSGGGTASDGGAALYRVSPGAMDVVLEDRLVIPGLGVGFGADVQGCAVAQSGAVLVVQRQPLPLASRVVQIRRLNPGRALTVDVMSTTQPIPPTEGNRRIDSDGDRAVVMSHTAGQFIVLDFFAVDAAGNWALEDTVRGGRITFGFSLFDVRLDGDSCVVVKASSTPVEAWERSPTGRWERASVEQATLNTFPDGAFLSGDSLYTRTGTPDGQEAHIYDRLPGGGWSLGATIPVTAPLGASVLIQDFHSSGDLFSFNIRHVAQAVLQNSSRIYRRLPTGAVTLQATLNAPIQSLGDQFAVVGNIAGKLKVIDRADLFGDVCVCTEAGIPTCTGQRAGDLRYLRGFNHSFWDVDKLMLSCAPGGQFAFVVGSDQRVPSAGMLSSLCVGTGAVNLRLPDVVRVAGDGTASWSITPIDLPLSSGGSTSGLGMRFTFQAVVRTYAGAATSRAVTVSL